jgi:hypothetical protein
MRRLSLPVLLGFFACHATGAMPPLLEGALEKYAADYDHWAYTQTVVERNEKGKVLREAVVRFDPSKPYPEQYTPLKIDGELPKQGDLKKYRKQGERREKRLAEAESEGTTAPQKTLGELMDLDRATLVEETEQFATFDVPLKKEGNSRLPPEKFKVSVNVAKRTGAFSSIVAELRSPVRAEVIVKIKSGVGRLTFATVQPEFTPAVESISGKGAGSILFVKVGRSYDLKRSDFVRVKPYANKFQVKMGPLKSIDF